MAAPIPPCETPTTIERIVARFVRLPLKAPFENRWQRIETWTKLLVEVHSVEAVGYGECTAMETPYYSYETIDTAWWAIETWFAGLLLNRPFSHPGELSLLFASISGHHEAAAALECACWDLFARRQDVPLCAAIGGDAIAVRSGATVGIHDDHNVLLAAVQAAVDEGYERIKLKIKPGHDSDVLAVVRSAFPSLLLLADANGAYEPRDIGALAALERFWPLVLEQPFPPSGWRQSAALQQRTSVPVCLDESIAAVEDVEHLLWVEAATMVNLKVGRVGGIANAIRIHDRCAEAGIPVFIGSKSETGIGRWTNVALATLPNVRYPSDVSASGRYFVAETVLDPVAVCEPGRVRPLDGAGIGTVVDSATLARYTTRTIECPR